MSLIDAIAEARAQAEPAPPNEAATCSWIIEPLLKACGYGLREIEPRVRDSNDQYPDYSILPNTPHTWYLEAKGWTVRLEDKHAQQALNYANQNGRRWVVLTNGHAWRLYDNQIQGLASDKVVADMRLAEVEAAEGFLRAISRPSVTSGDLERFAVETRMKQVLALQLADPGSDAIRAIWTVLRKQRGLGNVARADIVKFFSGRTRSVELEEHHEPKVEGSPSGRPELIIREHAAGTEGTVEARNGAASGSSGPGMVEVPSSAGSTAPAAPGWHDLETLRSEGVTGRKPVQLRLPNGDEVPVRSWAQVLLEACRYVVKRKPALTIPYPDRSGKKVTLISKVRPPLNLRSEEVQSSQGTLYVYVNYDADNCIANALHILSELPHDPAASPPAVIFRR